MEHGEVFTEHNDTQNLTTWKEYYRSVHSDFKELIQYYPFSELRIPPTKKPSLAVILVVAANRGLIEKTCSIKSDFTTEFTKELYLKIPVDYKTSGCNVYGGKWIDSEKISQQDLHIYTNDSIKIGDFVGYKMCVGTPESFLDMRNVILENVRTADNMLVAYERIMRGDSIELNLIAYSHGDKGRKEYLRDRKKYRTK